jgi:spore germination protein PE
MLKRTSKVNSLKVTSALFSSVIHIGDSKVIHGFSRVIAVQREFELFYANEANFDAYEIFSRTLPVAPITEPITIHSRSLNSLIKVGNINITGISVGAVLHIGSSENAQMEARTINIRQLQPRKKNTDNTDKEE